MAWQKIIEDILPTKWSRAVAVLTVLAAAGAYNFPSLLPASLLPTAAEQLFLVRCLLFLAIFLAGTLAVLVLVVVHCSKISRELAEHRQSSAALQATQQELTRHKTSARQDRPRYAITDDNPHGHEP